MMIITLTYIWALYALKLLISEAWYSLYYIQLYTRVTSCCKACNYCVDYLYGVVNENYMDLEWKVVLVGVGLFRKSWLECVNNDTTKASLTR